MQQDFTVVLKNKEPSIPVPNTGTLSDPNSLNLGTTLSDLVGGISVILTIALGICFVIYQAKKNNLAKTLTKIFTVTSLTTFILASIMSLNTFANNTGNTNNTNNSSNARSLSITLENSTLELQPTSEDTFAYTKSNIYVNESTNYGYTLSAYTTTPDLTNTKDSTQKISSLNSATKTVLTANTWGFSQSEPQDETSPVWQSLPINSANALTLKDIDTATPAQDPTDVYFGINVNDKLALGEYKGSITYTVVAKPELISYLDTGPTINIKMKNLANNTTTATPTTDDAKIKAILRATTLPNGFTPTTSNTISASTSPFPTYIFFDDVTGTMYYYTEARDIMMHSNSSEMFFKLTALTNIDGLAELNSSQVITALRMFSEAKSLTNIDALSNWDTSSIEIMQGMFNGASSLTNIDGVSKWNTSAVTNMHNMFHSTTSLIDIDGVKKWDISAVKNTSGMFQSATSLTDIDALESWNTSSIVSMRQMFAGAYSLTNVDGVSKWNTSAVTNMVGVFMATLSLTDIDGLKNWNTSAVTSMDSMFNNASALTDIDALSSWNTSAVTNMNQMFHYASSLTNIEGASKWNTSAVTNMAQMFYYASSLTNINGAKNWNTGNVTNIYAMFYNANNIDATVLNGWDVSKITNKAYAFSCPIDKRPSWY